MESSYFSGLISGGNPASIASLVIWIAAGVFVLAGVLFGLKRGFSRTVVRLITVIVSAVAAYFVASNLGDTITKLMHGMTPIEIWDSIVAREPALAGAMSEEIRNLVSSFDAEAAEHIVALFVCLVIVPIAFAAIFYALKLLTMIIYWIFVAIIGMGKKRVKISSRLLGAAVGLLQGAVIAGVVLLPMAGFSAVAIECREALTSENASEEQKAGTEEFYAWWIDDVIENPVLKTLEKAGGNALFENMTMMEFEDNKISTEDEIVTFIKIYNEATHLSGVTWDAPTDKDKETIDSILNLIGNDYYTATVISGVLRGLSTAVEREALVLTVEEPMLSFLNSIIAIFVDSNNENLHGDIATITHIYYILGDNEVLVNFYEDEALRDSLLTARDDGKNVIDYIVEELYKNSRTAPLVNTITEISIKIMCEEMNVSDEAQEIYENVKVGVTEILQLNKDEFETEEQYKDAVTEELSATLQENNITVDDSIIEGMSDYIVENYSDVSEITDEDINKAILSYYNSYAKGELELPDELPDEIPGDLEDILGGLTGGN